MSEYELNTNQIKEIKKIFRNYRLVSFLLNHPEISYNCLHEIRNNVNEYDMDNEVMTGIIIQALGIYCDYIKENNLECSLERIRYGMYAIKKGLSYAYIQYLMCTDSMDERNIKDVYSCFEIGVTLTRLTEVIRDYSQYTHDQINQICKAIIEVHNGAYDTQFLDIIKFHKNSANDIRIIRREAAKITGCLKSINKASKAHKWARISIEDADM